MHAQLCSVSLMWLGSGSALNFCQLVWPRAVETKHILFSLTLERVLYFLIMLFFFVQ